MQVRVSITLFEEADGRRERNFYPLALERNSVDLFTLHWTVVHPITADSPLRGATPDRLREAQAELLILVNAHEETFSTRVTTRASYWWDEIRWDAKFASIFASSRRRRDRDRRRAARSARPARARNDEHARAAGSSRPDDAGRARARSSPADGQRSQIVAVPPQPRCPIRTLH